MAEVIDGHAPIELQPSPRDAWVSLRRGLRNRCPHCGEGRILKGYLTVNRTCPVCGEELFHHQADDFPQYATIFIVGHVLIALMLFVDEVWPDLPVSVHYVVWPILVIALSLALLPRLKAGLIAYQWALRMHGFETATPSITRSRDATPAQSSRA